MLSIRFSGKRCGTAYFNPILWEKINKADQEQILFRIANTEPNDPQVTGRTINYPLQTPFINDSCHIRSARLKGVAPEIMMGRARQHHGMGIDPYPNMISKTGIISVGPKKQGMPQGGALANVGKEEYLLADHFSLKASDHGLGYGKYDKIKYYYNMVPKQIGFTVFLAESESDIRLAPYILSLEAKSEAGTDLASLGISFGQNVATLHDTRNAFMQGYAHRYLHGLNIGLISKASGATAEQSKVILRDFESAIALNILTPQQRMSYLFLDLAQALHFCQWITDTLASQFTVQDFTHDFISRYFDENDSQEALDHLAQDPNISKALVQFNQERIQGKKFNIVNYLNDHPMPFLRFLGQFLGNIILK